MRYVLPLLALLTGCAATQSSLTPAQTVEPVVKMLEALMWMVP